MIEVQYSRSIWPNEVRGLISAYLEGERDNVEHIYQKLCQDQRHESIQLLEFEDIKERRFGHWSMKGFQFIDLDENKKQEILNKYCQGSTDFYLPNDANSCLELIHDLELCC